MTEAVFDFIDIAKRLRGEPLADSEAPVTKKIGPRPQCQSLRPGCDYPDCPCGI